MFFKKSVPKPINQSQGAKQNSTSFDYSVFKLPANKLAWQDSVALLTTGANDVNKNSTSKSNVCGSNADKSSNQQQVSFVDKYSAHSFPPQRHLAISVWLFNDGGETLLQRRSAKKKVGPLKWGNSVCGNVRCGESLLACAYRRLYQELGIGEDLNWDEPEFHNNLVSGKNKLTNHFLQSYGQKIGLELKPVFEFAYQAYAGNDFFEHELDLVYIARASSSLRLNPQPNEVADLLWVNASEFLMQLNNLPIMDVKKSLLSTKKQLMSDYASREIELINWRYALGRNDNKNTSKLTDNDDQGVLNNKMINSTNKVGSANFSQLPVKKTTKKIDIVPWTIMMGQSGEMKKLVGGEHV